MKATVTVTVRATELVLTRVFNWALFISLLRAIRTSSWVV